MKVCALISGGKDSAYTAMRCIEDGHTIEALANLYPPSTAPSQELDSYMYQSVGADAIELYGKATGLPLYRRPIIGKPKYTDFEYNFKSENDQNQSGNPNQSVEEAANDKCTNGHGDTNGAANDYDEVEDLTLLLEDVLAAQPDIQAVSAGAIFSDYQRIRVESVAARLGLQVLAPLWHRPQGPLLEEMISAGVHAIIIKTAALGLEPNKHLGKTLAEIRPHMSEMNTKYGLNECGEGGEYESLVLNCPLFKNGKIVIDESEVVIHSNDAFAPVGYLKLTKLHLEPK